MVWAYSDRIKAMVDQTGARWNPIREWLRRVEVFRQQREPMYRRTGIRHS